MIGFIQLRPDDSEITKMADKEMRDAKDFVRKLNVVSTQVGSTQHTPVILDGCFIPGFKGKNDDDEKEKEDRDKHENNQKFGLLEALIKVGAWNHAEKILCQLPTYYATAQPGISKQLCK